MDSHECRGDTQICDHLPASAPNMKKMLVSLIFCIVLIIDMMFSANAALTNNSPTAIFVFGDSTADDGNNIFLSGEPPMANYPPYGAHFPGGTPTGRFSNGFLGVDFVAQAFGYQMSPPAFLSIKDNFATKYMNGVNFASAGSGILDTTGQYVITLNKQIDEFGKVSGNITLQLGTKPLADDFFARALFLFSVGSNDLFAAHFASIPMNDDAQRDQIVNPIITMHKDQLMALYNLGARKFGVIGTGQIGCVPAARKSLTAIECDENLNALSQQFKEAAKALFKDLSSSLDGFKYSFGDSHLLGSRINANPSQFGLTDLNIPCCSSLTSSFLCSPNSNICANPDQRYNWDGFHPTQATYKLVSGTFISGSVEFNTPYNMTQLVLG